MAKTAIAAKPALTEVCTVTLTFKKETPGTYVYATDDPDAAITQLYIRKAAMERKNGNVGPLKAITITVNGV
jgi:hypothetical protein